jgi:smad nuclear-interacting protein 1
MSHSPSLPAPVRDRSSQKDRSLVEKERNSTRTRSPSSRMKILRRAHAEKEGEKTRGREIERNYVKKGSEKGERRI